jgi:hypothetical protein
MGIRNSREKRRWLLQYNALAFKRRLVTHTSAYVRSSLVLAQSVTRKNLREEEQAVTLKNGKEHACKCFLLAKQGHPAASIA